ncbi:tetratricopeptide repeat protein [Bacteroidota bacterium]
MILNRLIIIILMFSGACVMSACKTGNDESMREINFYEHRKYGKLRIVYLKKPGMIQSWPCKQGKVRFYDNGKLLSFTLSEDHLKNDGLIPEGSSITLYRNGNPEFIRLASDTRIQGQRILGNKRFSDLLTGFYGEGGLKQYRAVADTIIEGIPCSNQSEMVLYPDGQLMVCQLSKDFTQGKNFFPAGSKVVIIESRNIYDYSQDIHSSIQSRLKMVTLKSEKINRAYELRMNGRVDQAYRTIKDLDKDDMYATPLGPYEMGRIRRHKLLNGAKNESTGSILRSTGEAANMDRYNIVFGFFHSDCASFAGYRTWMTGDSIKARGYYFRAIEGFERALKMKPDYHPARLSLVDLYSRLPEFLGGEREKAEMHANELKNYDPLWAARAESILMPDEAQRLEYWINIKESSMDDPTILYELGRAYLENNDIINGDTCYRRAMELDSGRIILLLDLARYHIIKAKGDSVKHSKHIEAAEAFILEYLEMDPIQPVKAWCYVQLASLYELNGKEEEAVKFLRDAKKLDQRYLKEDRLPPMILYNPPGELSNEYYSYFDTF